MYLKTLEIWVLKYTKFVSAPGLAWLAALKKTKVKLDLSTNTDVLIMVAKRIR